MKQQKHRIMIKSNKISMPINTKVKRLYHQKYRTEWEQFPSFAPWLQSGRDGFSAHCKICDVNVLARLASIKQHHRTRKHQDSLQCNEFYIQQFNKEYKEEPVEGVLEEPVVPLEPFEPLVKKVKKVKVPPKATVKTKSKLLPKLEEEFLSNDDSILETLICQEEEEEESFEYEEELEEEQEQQEPQESEPPPEEPVKPLFIKQETKINTEDLPEDTSHHEEDHAISEFDLFGKSVSLQLNHMDLEDALLCQERLQVVLTEFRLKILKRQREFLNKRNS